MKLRALLCSAVMLLSPITAAGATDLTFGTYHSPDEVNQFLKLAEEKHPDVCRLHKVARTPGDSDVFLVEIGSEVQKARGRRPAVFVAANISGTTPIATEAALYLIQQLWEKREALRDRTWYVLPVGSPDAARHYFEKPLLADPRNLTVINDDMDDREDEDGCEDLNGDGIISMMRVKDPEGQWVSVDAEPRLMKKADWSKGEKGAYKLYTEGIDNDGDGEYNEDGPGGVDVGISFPHLFQFFTTTGGPWAGSAAESFGLMELIYARPEIALVVTFGESNFCLKPPRSDRTGDVDFTRIRIPKEIGQRLNLDTERTYTMDELKEIAKRYVPPGMEITEAMVAGFLGLGAVVNPLPDDMKFYKELSEKYKEFLKENKLDAKRIEPAPDKDGSFELFAYYHLGLPSFAIDFWALPEVEKEKKAEAEITPEKLEGMTSDEFLALGEEKIAAFLKSVDAPDGLSAKDVIDGVRGGMMTTKKMAEMLPQMAKKPASEGSDEKEKALLAFSDRELAGKGFVPWKPYRHATLGEVEIGGLVPYAMTTPPASMVETLLKGQVPWVLRLADRLPRIRIAETKVTALGGSLSRLELWVANEGYLPYPTAIGRRNRRIGPVGATLGGDGYHIVDGKRRATIDSIGGNATAKLEWILHAEKRVPVEITVTSMNAGGDSRRVELGGGK